MGLSDEALGFVLVTAAGLATTLGVSYRLCVPIADHHMQAAVTEASAVSVVLRCLCGVFAGVLCGSPSRLA
jgi:hypothetical protein